MDRLGRAFIAGGGRCLHGSAAEDPIAKFTLLVLTNAVPGREAEFDAWYTDVHLADVLRVPGVVGARRLRRTEAQRDPGPHPFAYMALYECEADDPQVVIDGLRARSGTSEMPLSDAMAAERLVCFFAPIPGASLP